jgi:hypothetical protein
MEKRHVKRMFFYLSTNNEKEIGLKDHISQKYDNRRTHFKDKLIYK